MIPPQTESQSMEQTEIIVVDNKQIVLKNYNDQLPKETDFQLRNCNRIKLQAPQGSGSFLVKNLYLSCDPYMRGRMRDFHGSYLPPFTPGSVCHLFHPSFFFSIDGFFFCSSCFLMIWVTGYVDDQGRSLKGLECPELWILTTPISSLVI